MRQIVESSAGTPKTGVSVPQGRKFGILVGSGGHPSMVGGGGSLNVPNVKQCLKSVPNVKARQPYGLVYIHLAHPRQVGSVEF